MKTTLNALHHQDLDWLRELEFYKDEVAVLTTRLEEVMKRNTSKDIAARAEQFQNKFFLLREEVDNLKHDIGKREDKVEKVAGERPNHIDEKYLENNHSLQTRMKALINGFADIRFAFNKFLAEVF